MNKRNEIPDTSERTVYLDYSATTPVDPFVVEAMLPYFSDEFGNPGSTLHSFGKRAKEGIEAARKTVADFLGADSSEIVFTSGGTESNSLAIEGAARHFSAQGKRHLVTSLTEHKSVLECCKMLERNGFEVTYLKPGADGRIDFAAVKAAVRDDTFLVSLMMVNNEIGVIAPYQEIAELTAEKGILFHADAVQAVGKIPIDLGQLKIDLLSFSAHKIYGPKGVGALVVRTHAKHKLLPIVRGGGQEGGLRGGSHNVPGIVGMARACALAGQRLLADQEEILPLRNSLYEAVLREIPDVVLNGSPTHRIYNNLSLSFPGVDGEQFLTELGGKLAISSGSACAAGSSDVSHVLKSIGVAPELARATIRLSLGRGLTEQDVDYAARTVISTVRRHRRQHEVAPARKVEDTVTGREGQFTLNQIASVTNDIKEPSYIKWKSVTSTIVVRPEWVPALDNLDEYSHVMIVFFMHYVEDVKLHHVPQAMYQEVPSVGILACRCPYRPNPIAVSVATLIEVKGNTLVVRGLDAVNGSPVLDIKPYTPQMDQAQGVVRVPPWAQKLVY